MKTLSGAKRAPEIGYGSKRLLEDHRTKPELKTQAGTVICEHCLAIGQHKHWFFDHKLSKQLAGDPLVRFVTCPGCKRVEDKIYEGEVTLDSPLLAANKDMVYGTLFHEAAKGFLHNPLSRVAVFEDSGDKIRIVTTTCTLAERLGKAIYKAFKGKIEIKPSPGEQFVFVKWWRHDG